MLVTAISAPFVETSRLPLIGNMLSRPHLIEKATPILIMLLFAWVLFEIAVKQRQVRRQHAAIATFQTQIGEGDNDQYQPKAYDLSQLSIKSEDIRTEKVA